MRSEEELNRWASSLGLSTAAYKLMLTHIKRAAAAKNLSQTEIGRRLGSVSQPHVSGMLGAKRQIGRDMLQRFARELQMEASLLIGGHIATGRVLTYEVRPAVKDDAATIFQLSVDLFPQEVLFNDQAVSGWVSQGHYRVIVENDLHDSSSVIIGYHGVWPVSRHVYESIRDRPGREKELAPGMGCGLDSDELYGLYILDVAGPRDRLATALCFDLGRYVNFLCGRHGRIERVGAWAYSEPGKKLCTDLGLEFHETKSQFYEIESREIRSKDLPPLAKYILRRPFQEKYNLF